MCLCVFIFISVVTQSLLASDPGILSCRYGSGNGDEYKCLDGMNCIKKEQVCNGFQDCLDGSDEIFCPNHDHRNYLQSIPGFNRSKRQSTCNDETGVSCQRELTSNSSMCILPPYPEHGTYEVAHFPNAQPGQSLSTFVLTVKCRKGYGIVDPHDDGSGTKQVYCIYGEWYQEMPKCVRFCKLNKDPSIRYMCYLPGTRIEVCQNYVPPGTIVEPVCNRPLYYSTEDFTNMRCISGFWNYVPTCKAECGRITPIGKLLVIGGRRVKRGELPWHAGVYRRLSQSYSQICSGSLVSNSVVISAAHCFWRASKTLPASDFAVGIGKIIRSWESEEDVDAQKSDVKEIKIPSLFQGERANFQDDIAILIMMTPFSYTTYIRPVCLNFNPSFENWQLQNRKLGKVAGWGLTAANDGASEFLRVIEIPYISVQVCFSILPDTFREYITSDKFCAGDTTGTALCQGDSGGGLAFSDKEYGIDRYYLRGVVSASPNDGDKQCNDNTLTAFTKISKHQDFIKEALAATAPNVCPLYSFQCDDGTCVEGGSDCNGRRDCEDGSDEFEEYCQVGAAPNRILLEEATIGPPTLQTTQSVPPTTTELLPKHNLRDCGFGFNNITNKSQILTYNGHRHVPWLVAIFTVNDTNKVVAPIYICGGTLISDRHILTLASRVKNLLPNTMKAVLGGNTKAWSNESPIVRKVKWKSLFLFPDLTVSAFENDISVLTLDQRVKLSTYLQPACLWNGQNDLTKIVGDFGLFAGWGYGAQSLEYVGDPHQLRMQVANKTACELKKFEFLKLNKFVCAKDPNNKNPLMGDAGGGLYVMIEGQWTLHGIFPLFNENLDGNIVFIDLERHVPWIYKILEQVD